MKTPSPIVRRVSRQIWVGDVPVGGDAPISVQSMTNTETCDVAATVAQVRAIQDAGADIVRVSVPSMDAAEAFREIRAQVTVPLVADIHFDHRIALKVAQYGVDCLRINPGNIGRDDKVRAVIDCARDRGIPIRIGVNAGSLTSSASWARICSASTVSPPPRRWWSPPCATWRSSTSSTTRTSRSASRHPMCSWRWPLTACWQKRSNSPCTWV